MPPRDKTIAAYREQCLSRGTYLADLTKELTWYTVGATNASYLIQKSDAGPRTDPDDRPDPVELTMVCQVAERDWWFRSEAFWRKDAKNNSKNGISLPFEKTKLGFLVEPSNDSILVEDFNAANANLTKLMDEVRDPGLPTEGGIVDHAMKIRHAIFGSREEVPAAVVEKAPFDIAQWPVFTNDAKIALETIAETHYIRTPPIYDLPGQLVKPHMYFKRFRSALVVVHFTVTFYRWEMKNTFCMDLAHLRVLVTPSPATPVTPRQKGAAVLRVDERYPMTQPVFKKARIDEDVNEGDHSPSPKDK